MLGGVYKIAVVLTVSLLSILGKHCVDAKLSSTLPAQWNYLIPDDTFQDRLYIGICGVMKALNEFDM